jgi:hypothetical protein
MADVGIRVTKESIEVLGKDLGRVTPINLSTSRFGFWRANWRAQVDFSTTWQTDITRAHDSLAEQRTGLQERPVHSMRSLLTGMTHEEATRLLMHMHRLAKHRHPVPLFQDQTTLLADASGTTLVCDTLDRSLYLGQRVAVLPRGHARIQTDVNEFVDVFFGEIAALSPTGITLVDPLPVTIPAGGHVYPLIDCLEILTSEFDLHTDQVPEVEIQAHELSGISTLPPSWDEDVDAYFPTFEGLPIFDVHPNWRDRVRMRIAREGERYAAGLSESQDVQGDRARFGFEMDYLEATRADALKIRRFFDSRRGRLRPFWLLSPQTFWKTTGVSTTHMGIEPFGYMEDIEEFLTHVGIELTDGTTYVREIEDVQQIDTPALRYRIIWSSNPLPSAPTNVERVTAAHLARFDSDTLTERWHTDTTVETSLSFTELLNEASVALA